MSIGIVEIYLYNYVVSYICELTYMKIKRERQKKIFIALLFSMIMIFSAFTIYENTSTSSVTNNNTQQSIPIQSYNAYGESVCFIGNQPVISFSSNPMATHYPVSWDILSVNTGGIHNTNSATPFITTNNNTLVINQFTHYRTSRINDTTQNSAQLIQCSNTTQSASVFFFHHYTMSASLAWKNKHPYNQTYMIDFTMITPYSNNYHVGGDNGFHNMTLNNNTGIIPASCVNLQVGGMDLYWMSDASLFHGGMIEQKDHHDIVVIPFGTVTLQGNETYTIDPSIEPAPMIINPGGGGVSTSGGGGSGSGGGGSGSGSGSGSGGGSCSTPVTTYPPKFACLNIKQSPSTCFANGSKSDHISICYDLCSLTENGPVKLGFFERETNGEDILLGTHDEYQEDYNTFSANLNNLGFFSGLYVAYECPGTTTWTCIQKLGHSFTEYMNFSKGYIYPDLQATPNAGDILNSNGKLVAEISSVVNTSQDPVSACVNSHMVLTLTQMFVSKGDAYGATNRCVSFSYATNNKGITGQSQYYREEYITYNSTIMDTEPATLTILSIALILATIALTVATAGFGYIFFVALVLGGVGIYIAVSLYQCYPDHTVLQNKKDCSGEFNCCDPATDKFGANEPYNYFYTTCDDCCHISNTFGQGVSIGVGKSTITSSVVEQFTYTSGFTIFNTTLNGSLCREKYSGTLTSPVDIYYEAPSSS